jgi:hypothetical protein
MVTCLAFPNSKKKRNKNKIKISLYQEFDLRFRKTSRAQTVSSLKTEILLYLARHRTGTE